MTSYTICTQTGFVTITITTQSLKTSWLAACQCAIQNNRVFSVVATKSAHKKWDGRMAAITK